MTDTSTSSTTTVMAQIAAALPAGVDRGARDRPAGAGPTWPALFGADPAQLSLAGPGQRPGDAFPAEAAPLGALQPGGGGCPAQWVVHPWAGHGWALRARTAGIQSLRPGQLGPTGHRFPGKPSGCHCLAQTGEQNQAAQAPASHTATAGREIRPGQVQATGDTAQAQKGRRRAVQRKNQEESRTGCSQNRPGTETTGSVSSQGWDATTGPPSGRSSLPRPRNIAVPIAWRLSSQTIRAASSNAKSATPSITPTVGPSPAPARCRT